MKYKTIYVHEPDYPQVLKFVYPLCGVIMVNLDAQPGANLIRLSYSTFAALVSLPII